MTVERDSKKAMFVLHKGFKTNKMGMFSSTKEGDDTCLAGKQGILWTIGPSDMALLQTPFVCV